MFYLCARMYRKCRMITPWTEWYHSAVQSIIFELVADITGGKISDSLNAKLQRNILRITVELKVIYC